MSPISAALARKLIEIEPPLREAMLLLVEEVEKQREQMAQQVTKAEFRELQEAVKDLTAAVGRLADGVVVGSALLRALAVSEDPVQAARRFLRNLRQGLEEGEIPLPSSP